MGLNKKQEEGLRLAKEWYNNDSHRPFVLSGIAGSGKSYTMTKIIDSLGLHEANVSFIAYTGMAAGVLVKRGLNATTIHRTIYNHFMDEKTGKVNFTLKDELPSDIKLIIIDEVSMVPMKMIEEIQSFGIPILCLGDPAQLKSLSGRNELLDKPDIFLDEPVRQSLDNPILVAANLVRNGKDLEYGSYGDNVHVITSDELTLDMYKNADQVLMSYNRTVDQFNRFYRSQILNIDVENNPFPKEDEKIMCLKNNWSKVVNEGDITQYLTNGLIGNITRSGKKKPMTKSTQMDFKPKGFEKERFSRIYYDDLIFEGTIGDQQELFDLRHRDNEINKIFKKRYVTEMSDFGMKVNPFNFAYGITIHKSQGSEFDNVIVFSENMSKDRFKSLYTAITRAKKNLIVVQ
ncbi:hypothetical protein [Staphylococcus phage LY01]|nr:hypothetical protein [Staphylococcus phage LY01]